MPLEKRTKQIGSHEYEVTQLDAVRGRRVMVRLAKIMAPLFNVSGGDTTARLATALQNIHEDDVDFLCETFQSTTCVVQTNDRGQTVKPDLAKIFPVHFAGLYDEMIQWLIFCLEVNFGNFFDRLGQKSAD